MASSFSSSSLLFEDNSNTMMIGNNNNNINNQAMIDELVHGRDLATQLRALISGDCDGAPAESLVSEIMATFTNTLIMLDDHIENDDEEMENDSRFVETIKSEDSEESSRSVSTAETTTTMAAKKKDRRGCYKRRKSLNSWQRETPNLIDDGHAWRKYGQKAILKSKYPRNYFRCTHKYDQKCQAIKHVQRVQESPPLYMTTYHGNHTCRNLLSPPELVLDCASPNRDSSNSMLLSFNLESKQPHIHNHPFFNTTTTSTTTSYVKQEVKEEIIINDNKAAAMIMMPFDCGTHNRLLSDDYFVGFDDDHRRNQRSDFDICGLIGVESFEDDVFRHLDLDNL